MLSAPQSARPFCSVATPGTSLSVPRQSSARWDLRDAKHRTVSAGPAQSSSIYRFATKARQVHAAFGAPVRSAVTVLSAEIEKPPRTSRRAAQRKAPSRAGATGTGLQGSERPTLAQTSCAGAVRLVDTYLTPSHSPWLPLPLREAEAFGAALHCEPDRSR